MLTRELVAEAPKVKVQFSVGDTVRIIVHNDVPDNGTGIHWHGVRQLHSCPNDGANGVTECPIAYQSTKTYEFRATQHGSSWQDFSSAITRSLC